MNKCIFFSAKVRNNWFDKNVYLEYNEKEYDICL